MPIRPRKSVCNKLTALSTTATLMLAVAASPNARAQEATANKDDDRKTLLDRIEALEKRLSDLESSAVLSEPETRVKKVEV